MSKFKQKKGDYFIHYVLEPNIVKYWTNTESECLERFKYGNCFRTKKEAEKVLKKVKKLLLSLHRGKEE